MKNLKKIFGKKLTEYIALKYSQESIGALAYSFYHENMLEMGDDLESFLIDISVMEMGPEFALSYDELKEISDTLINGKIPDSPFRPKEKDN